jgi:hypothetical protein
MSRSTPKVIALLLMSLFLAWLLGKYDAQALSMMDSMSPAEYIRHQRALHGHSFLMLAFSCLVCGGFFLGTIEFVAYLIEDLTGKRKAST